MQYESYRVKKPELIIASDSDYLISFKTTNFVAFGLVLMTIF